MEQSGSITVEFVQSCVIKRSLPTAKPMAATLVQHVVWYGSSGRVVVSQAKGCGVAACQNVLQQDTEL